MSSTSNNPKPSVVTGYPAGDASSAASNTNGPDANTAYPYYANTNPNPNPYHHPQNPNSNPNYYLQNPNPNPNPNYYPQNPNPNPNPHYYYPPNPNPNNRGRRSFFRRLFAIFVAAFIVLGAIVLIVYLVLRPKTPAVTLTSLSVSSFNLSSDSLSGDFNLSLAFDNPNSKISVYYDHLVTTVYLGTGRVAVTSLAPLFQPKYTSTTLNAQMAAVSEFIGEDTASSIRSGFGKGEGNVELDVLVGAFVRFRSGIWRTRWHLMRVDCQDANVAFKNGSGSMNNGPIRCWIGL